MRYTAFALAFLLAACGGDDSRLGELRVRQLEIQREIKAHELVSNGKVMSGDASLRDEMRKTQDLYDRLREVERQIAAQGERP